MDTENEIRMPGFCPNCGTLLFAGVCRKCNPAPDIVPALSYEQQRRAKNVERLLRMRDPSIEGFSVREREDPTNRILRRERMKNEVIQILEAFGEHPRTVQQSAQHYHIVLETGELCLRPGSRASRTIPRTAVGTKFSEAGAAIWDETIALEGASHLILGVISDDPDVRSDYYVFGAAEAMRLAMEAGGFIEDPPESARSAWNTVLTHPQPLNSLVD